MSDEYFPRCPDGGPPCDQPGCCLPRVVNKRGTKPGAGQPVPPECGIKSLVPGFNPCNRSEGHAGPCRHEITGREVFSPQQKQDDAAARKSTMRRFLLVREEDVHNTSGTGTVAEGVEFSNGQVSLHWLSQLESVAIYGNSKVLGQLRGHHGKTKVVWLDGEA